MILIETIKFLKYNPTTSDWVHAQTGRTEHKKHKLVSKLHHSILILDLVCSLIFPKKQGRVRACGCWICFQIKKVGCTQSYKLASILCDSLDELITWVEILNFFS